MTTETAQVYTLSANAEFKAQYNKTVRWATVIALVITIVAFIVSPDIKFTPYKLRQEEIEVVDMDDQPEDFVLPPPPEASAKPANRSTSITRVRIPGALQASALSRRPITQVKLTGAASRRKAHEARSK